jgi:hypothetical protein
METFSVRNVPITSEALQPAIAMAKMQISILQPKCLLVLAHTTITLLATVVDQANKLLGTEIRSKLGRAYFSPDSEDEDRHKPDMTFHLDDAILLIVRMRCEEGNIETIDNIEELRAAYENNKEKNVGLGNIVYGINLTPTRSLIFRVTFNEYGNYTIAKSSASPHTLKFFTHMPEEQFTASAISFTSEAVGVLEEQVNRMASK